MPQPLEALIMDLIHTSDRKYTPLDLERAITAEHSVSGQIIRQVIRQLISKNRLVYTHLLGHSFLEISYKRPVHIGGGIILTPPDVFYMAGPEEIVVRIAPGVSFGIGDHATTRIALQLMAWAFENRTLPQNSSGTRQATRALDIGTGSGVLAIAACLKGITEAVGTDIEACARVEALENVRLNNLGNCIRITDATLDASCNSFSLVLANLRYPTLIQLEPEIQKICLPGALLIFSGFREHELADLLSAYPAPHYKRLKTLSQNNWCGIALQTKRV